MAFHEAAIFPEDISYGSAGGPGFKTNYVEASSGYVEKNSRWDGPRHKYDVAYGVKSYSQLADLKRFFIARGGGANGFRFVDFLDFSTAADGRSEPTPLDQYLGEGTGAAGQTVQLTKRYSDAGHTWIRSLKKPIDGTIVVAVDGVEVTSGWSVDPATGLMTHSLSGVLTFGCKFHVPVSFAKTTDDWLNMSIDAFESGDASVELVEDFYPDAVPGMMPTLGCLEVFMEGDLSVNPLTATTYHLQSDESGRKVILPDPAPLPTGRLLFIVNSGSYPISIQYDGDELVALNSGKGVELLNTKTASQTNEWFAL